MTPPATPPPPPTESAWLRVFHPGPGSEGRQPPRIATGQFGSEAVGEVDRGEELLHRLLEGRDEVDLRPERLEPQRAPRLAHDLEGRELDVATGVSPVGGRRRPPLLLDRHPPV